MKRSIFAATLSCGLSVFAAATATADPAPVAGGAFDSGSADSGSTSGSAYSLPTQLGSSVAGASIVHFNTPTFDNFFGGDLTAIPGVPPVVAGFIANTTSGTPCNTGRVIFKPRAGGEEVHEVSPLNCLLPIAPWVVIGNQPTNAYAAFCTESATGETRHPIACYQLP
ncbi:hypothetical protein ACIP5Y_20340 [Nocardia sp. NPDC088792]|uniref:hypothetical protein n=1 Tax=Nocardia sp. NPDC088792 TaxID=3364332 RepID=UPI003817285A